MSISLPGGAKSSLVPLKSTHGVLLIQELQDPSTCDIEVVKDCLSRDKLAGRLKSDGGNNAFHILMRKSHQYKSPAEVLEILILLYHHSPEGIGAKNDSQLNPLHLALQQKNLHPFAIAFIVKHHPQSCSAVTQQGDLALHLYLKREQNDAEFELCKEMCKANPEGPKTLDALQNLPIHYLVRNCRPNRDILAMLLKRYPEGASAISHWGGYPLHLLCGVSDDLEAIKLVHSLFPEAIKMPDRHGRSCLHLAALSVGREHQEEIRRKEDRLEAEKRSREGTKTKDKNGSKKAGEGEREEFAKEYDDDYDDDDDDELEAGGSSDALLQEQGKSREHVRWIIAQWPEALTRVNNFQATPVETVLEKTKATNSKHKNILVFGLFDDPPTARILLLAQRHYAAVAGSRVAVLRNRYLKPMQELNWLARRLALFVALQGEIRPLKIGSARICPWGSGAVAGNKRDAILKTHIQHAAKKEREALKNAALAPNGTPAAVVKKCPTISPNNVLARLKREGKGECVMLVVAWL